MAVRNPTWRDDFDQRLTVLPHPSWLVSDDSDEPVRVIAEKGKFAHERDEEVKFFLVIAADDAEHGRGC